MKKRKPTLPEIFTILQAKTSSEINYSHVYLMLTNAVVRRFPRFDSRFACKATRTHLDCLTRLPAAQLKQKTFFNLKTETLQRAAGFKDQFQSEYIDLLEFYPDVLKYMKGRYEGSGDIVPENAVDNLYEQIRNTGASFLGKKTLSSLKWHAYKLSTKTYKEGLRTTSLDANGENGTSLHDILPDKTTFLSQIYAREKLTLALRILKRARAKSRSKRFHAIADLLLAHPYTPFDRRSLFEALTPAKQKLFMPTKPHKKKNDEDFCLTAVSKQREKILAVLRNGLE